MKKLYFSIALLFACNVLNATTFQVLNSSDSGPNSLRQCITDANADLSATYQNPHVIHFALADGDREISLLSALPAIDNHIVIDGQSEYVKISGGSGFRVFKVNSEKYVNFNWLILTKGKLTSGNGGCIYNSGFLTLNNVSVDGNDITGIGNGGGIYNEGYLEMANSWVINNHNAGSDSNFGGGIYNSVESVINITRTTIGSNWASAGGGVMNDGDATFTDMTFTNNLGGAYGGGLFNRNYASLTNVTLFNTNQAEEGGAIASSWSIVLINNTITTNEIGGGIFIMENSSISLLNTIVAGNEGSISIAKDDIYSNSSVMVSAKHCLFGNVGSLITLSGTNNKTDVASEAAFGKGSTNGFFNDSKTETISLAEGSLAINAGTSEDAPSYDQVGQERVGQTDIGAFEYQTPLTSIMKQEQQNDLKIFSDQGNGIFRFELANSMQGNYEWKVIDINGRVLQSSNSSGRQNDTAFDLSSHPQGIYILIVSSDKGVMTKEVVKL